MSNWNRRPLRKSQLDYAALQSNYLVSILNELTSNYKFDKKDYTESLKMNSKDIGNCKQNAVLDSQEAMCEDYDEEISEKKKKSKEMMQSDEKFLSLKQTKEK